MNSENNEIIEKKRNKNLISIKIKKSTLQAFLIPAVFLLGLWVGYLSWGKDTQVAPILTDTNPAKLENGQQPSIKIELLESDPKLIGENAKITIVEFSDFECPYCQRHNQEVFARIIETYGDQIEYVFKDFPLYNIHPNAVSAAVAAHCANDQGMFWDYHDLLFGNSLGLSNEALIQYSTALGLETNQFSNCILSENAISLVQNNYQQGQNLGVTSTPSFFINGTALIGAQPFEVFAQVIESELAKVNE